MWHAMYTPFEQFKGMYFMPWHILKQVIINEWHASDKHCIALSGSQMKNYEHEMELNEVRQEKKRMVTINKWR